MIRQHDFNSQWWGGPVGIVESLTFFKNSPEEQQRALEAYEWVELRVPLETAPLAAIADAGFVQFDVQLPFRINLTKVASTSGFDELTVERADEKPFAIEGNDLAFFRTERYRHLPGMTAERLGERYAAWSQQLLDTAPEWCLRVSSGGNVQGWFLSRMTEDGLSLELAMLHRAATVSGLYLYQKGLVAYAERARLGYARFSVMNVPVLNIYSRLGAQYLAPAGSWLWLRDRDRT